MRKCSFCSEEWDSRKTRWRPREKYLCPDCYEQARSDAEYRAERHSSDEEYDYYKDYLVDWEPWELKQYNKGVII